jgi:phage gp29-like protein
MKNLIAGLLNKWLKLDEGRAVFSVTSLPDSPLGGITLDKLRRIINDSRRGQADDLFALVSDICSGDTTFIAGALQRKGPLVARPTSVVTAEKDTAAITRRDAVRGQWRRCRGKRVAISHLLDASTWPVSYCRKIWQETKPGSAHYYDLTALEPVPLWQITFRADPRGPAGVPKIKKFDAHGNWNGDTELPDALNYVTHRGHLLQANPDCWGGPMRAVVFWWYFATLARQLWANYLESQNQPKWIAKYGRVDWKKSKRELLAAFNRATVTTALVVPEDAKIEAVQTLKGEAAAAFGEFVAVCQREIGKVIVAQTLTLEAQAQGIGGTQAKEHGDQLDGVREFDAALLAETIEEQVFRSWLDLNGMAGGSTPTLSWSADDDAAAVKADMLNDLKLAGLRVRLDGMEKVSAFVGLPMERVPEPGEGEPAPPPPARLSAFAAGAGNAAEQARAATDALADRTAADLADAFGGDFAAMSRALRDADSPADLLRRLQPAVAGLAPHRATRVLEDALAAAAANGLICAHHAAAR